MDRHAGAKKLVEKDASTRFRWWTPRGSEVQVREHEIRSRVVWGVSVRWLFVAIGALGTGCGAAELLPADADVGLLALATLLLAVCNAAFSVLLIRKSSISPRSFLIWEALADFAALTVLSYALGTVETPIVILYMPHLALLTLLLDSKASVAVTALAAALASTPLFLVRSGVLPVVSVFGSDLPAKVADSTPLTLGFALGIFACFATCWYLVSQMSNGLVLREKRLEKVQDRLSQAARTKTMATLRATHELKAPLAAIKSYVYTMRDGYTGELPAEALRVVQRIGDRCDLLTERITDIIHLSNLETLTSEELELGEIDLYDLTSSEAVEAALRGEPRSVRVDVEPRPIGPTLVSGSLGELKSLLANLLDNAVEYSHPEGEVTVTVASDGSGTRVRIVDNGIGIPTENLPHIFLDHFRSDNAVAHKANGSGLGMAIASEIARLHGAEILVSSELGRGTVVSLIFPHIKSTHRSREWPAS